MPSVPPSTSYAPNIGGGALAAASCVLAPSRATTKAPSCAALRNCLGPLLFSHSSAYPR